MTKGVLKIGNKRHTQGKNFRIFADGKRNPTKKDPLTPSKGNKITKW